MDRVDPNQATPLVNIPLEPQPVPVVATQGHLAERPFALLFYSPVVEEGISLVDILVKSAQNIFSRHGEGAVLQLHK